jgi:hypothetical protein
VYIVVPTVTVVKISVDWTTVVPVSDFVTVTVGVDTTVVGIIWVTVDVV